MNKHKTLRAGRHASNPYVTARDGAPTRAACDPHCAEQEEFWEEHLTFVAPDQMKSGP